MTEDKNRLYLKGIKEQDSNVLRKIYSDILPGIVKWVKQNGGNEEDGQDLFQEMIISVYKKVMKGNFELSCSFWSYALVVCRNLWFAKRRNKDRMKYTDNINGEKVVIHENMQTIIEQKELMDLYRKHFNQLGDKCQKILSMFFAKIKMVDIAEKLDTTAAYIKKRKFKCKEALINKIKEDHLYNEITQL